MRPTSRQSPASCSSPELLVLDLMYVPAETQLLRDAEAAGATEAMNGDTMLIHQTAAAFSLWTGRDIGLDFVQKQLDEVRDARRRKSRRPRRRERTASATPRGQTLATGRSRGQSNGPSRATFRPATPRWSSSSRTPGSRPAVSAARCFATRSFGGGKGHVDLPRLRRSRRPCRRPDRRNGVAGSAWIAVALAFQVAGPAALGRISLWPSPSG